MPSLDDMDISPPLMTEVPAAGAGCHTGVDHVNFSAETEVPSAVPSEEAGRPS